MGILIFTKHRIEILMLGFLDESDTFWNKIYKIKVRMHSDK